MSSHRSKGSTFRTHWFAVAGALLVLLALSGCLEQVQTTRIPSGAMQNFLLHLRLGEVDDARTYFAPGLVTPSANLDNSLIDASRSVRAYEIRNLKTEGTDLGKGERRETIKGEVRPRTPAGQPTSGLNKGWQQTTIISGRMVERGPGWRLLDFKLECCPAP